MTQVIDEQFYIPRIPVNITVLPNGTTEAFALRSAKNPIGRKVKLADLYDNSDTSRIPSPPKKITNDGENTNEPSRF